MTKRLLIRGAKQLLTLRGGAGPRRGAEAGDLGVIPDGALLIENGRIAHVGPTRRIENLNEAKHAEELDAYGQVVMPGLVDGHNHLVCGPPRLRDYEQTIDGFSPDEVREQGGGVLASLRLVRNWTISRMETQAGRTLNQVARHGTTTVEARSGYGLDEASELKLLRAALHWDRRPLDIYASLFALHFVPPEYEGHADAYVDWVCRELLPLVARRKLATFAAATCSESDFGPEQVRRYLEAARSVGLLPRIEGDASSFPEAVRIGIGLEAPTIDVSGPMAPEEIVRVAESECVATLLPGSAFHLGTTEYPPARRLIESGAAVALATDYNAFTSPCYNMQMMMSLACSQMKMSPAQAITAATINAAWAMNLAPETGSLEYGKLADIIIMGVPDYREIPFHFGLNQVNVTIKNGEVLQVERGFECVEI